MQTMPAKRPRKQLKKVTLTRWQIDRMMAVVALDDKITSVTIEEVNESGIGPSHWITWHSEQGMTRDDDLTDVGIW